MVVQVVQRVLDLAKTGTSGMESEDEINGIINSAQKTLQQMLLDVAEVNTKATDALNWLKDDAMFTSGAEGAVVLPAGYLHLDTLSLIQNGGEYEAYKLPTNQVNMTRTSPIRKPVLANNQLRYYFKKGAIYVMPEQANITGRIIFYKQVPDASIVFTPVSNDDGDLITITQVTDFGWPDSMFNILVYLILEGLGIEIREQLLLEYSALGINREMIKTAAQ